MKIERIREVGVSPTLSRSCKFLQQRRKRKPLVKADWEGVSRLGTSQKTYRPTIQKTIREDELLYHYKNKKNEND